MQPIEYKTVAYAPPIVRGMLSPTIGSRYAGELDDLLALHGGDGWYLKGVIGDNTSQVLLIFGRPTAAPR
jgi:hypothetical protein